MDAFPSDFGTFLRAAVQSGNFLTVALSRQLRESPSFDAVFVGYLLSDRWREPSVHHDEPIEGDPMEQPEIEQVTEELPEFGLMIDIPSED
ncbi:hypothetical protein ACIRD6_29715 [Streptomyces sp. NPDC102473]|uniref:hypothetical protein n=1 Tax=Streptomyces sp. NPDC102473 TaxID=3366180 RepID=UPI00380F7E1D